MLALGVDIGGTNARAAVVERQTGKILDARKEPLPGHEPAAVVEVVAKLVDAVAHGRALDGRAVGVGFAGMLRGPVVVNAPNFGWREVDFGTALAGKLGRPAQLVNDLSAAAWGERSAGAARGAADTFTVYVGTGVGSAIISGGRLLHGASGVAGEFGHLKVLAEGGRPCGCGGTGCLEAYMGGARLTAWMREEGLEGTPEDLERQALAGSPVARRLYDFAVGHLALAVANQVTVLNPAVVVLGGGVLAHCPEARRRIAEVVAARAVGPAAAAVAVKLAELGDDSGIVGAALLAAES